MLQNCHDELGQGGRAEDSRSILVERNMDRNTAGEWEQCKLQHREFCSFSAPARQSPACLPAWQHQCSVAPIRQLFPIRSQVSILVQLHQATSQSPSHGRCRKEVIYQQNCSTGQGDHSLDERYLVLLFPHPGLSECSHSPL